MTELSAYIKEKRASRDISVRKLGELAGISHTEIKRIEDGVRKQPSPQTLRDIATALNVPYEEIMAAAGYVAEPYYTEIADDYKNKGDYNLALEYYQKALAASIAEFGEEHKSVATLYASIGVVYFELAQYEACLEYFLKALAIVEKLLGEKHPETVALYNNLAMAYKNTGEEENSEKYLQRVMLAHELGHIALHSKNEANMLRAAGVGDTEDLTEDELAEVNTFIEFIKNKRK